MISLLSGRDPCHTGLLGLGIEFAGLGTSAYALLEPLT